MVETEGSGGAGEDPRYTPEEIYEAIASLSAADIARVRMMSRYFSQRSGMSPEDLEQETFVRALGTRSCRVGTSIVAFLGGVMKSIASEAPRARKRARTGDGGLELIFVADYGVDGIPEPGVDELSPEDAALSRVYHGQALQKAMACIEDDEELQLLAEGLFDGMRGKDLEALLGTDTKGLAAAQRRLARRLQAKFPLGVQA